MISFIICGFADGTLKFFKEWILWAILRFFKCIFYVLKGVIVPLFGFVFCWLIRIFGELFIWLLQFIPPEAKYYLGTSYLWIKPYFCTAQAFVPVKQAILLGMAYYMFCLILAMFNWARGR